MLLLFSLVAYYIYLDIYYYVTSTFGRLKLNLVEQAYFTNPTCKVMIYMNKTITQTFCFFLDLTTDSTCRS